MELPLRTNKPVNPLISVIVLLVFFGCAAPKGKAYLFPDDNRLKGMYHKEGTDEGVFENGSIRVAVRRVKASDYEGSPLLKNLSDKKYVILSVGIENKSKLKAIYNPSMTVLTDDSMDYKKPLDYTDLYDAVIGDSALESGLSAMKGKFYDLALTLQPGEKTVKLLIFEPLSENTDKADLAMSDIYIGTETVNLRFPFLLKSPEI